MFDSVTFYFDDQKPVNDKVKADSNTIDLILKNAEQHLTDIRKLRNQ